LEEYLAELNSISKIKGEKLTFQEALNKWNSEKSEHDDNYTYSIISLFSDESRVKISTFDVKNNTVYSRKDVMIERTTTDMSWICKPYFDHCPIKLQIDSLRAEGGDYKSLMVEHMENHLIITKKDSVWAEFKSNQHYLFKNPLSSIPAMTMDELFEKIRSSMDDHQRLPAKMVNETYGYIQYFSLHAIKDVEPPENQFLQDYSVPTYFIVGFQWH